MFTVWSQQSSHPSNPRITRTTNFKNTFLHRSSVSIHSRRNSILRTASSRRDKSNRMFSARQPLEQCLPSRHPSNKTSSNHDPSPPRKPPRTAQSTKAYINVMRPWPRLPHQSTHPPLHTPTNFHFPTLVHGASLGLSPCPVYVSSHRLSPLMKTEQSDKRDLFRFAVRQLR